MCKYDDKNKIIHITNPRTLINISYIRYLNQVTIGSMIDRVAIDVVDDLALDDFLKTGIKIDGDFRVRDLDKVTTSLSDVSKIPVTGEKHKLMLYTPSDVSKDGLKKFLNKKTSFNTLYIYDYNRKTTQLSSITTYDNIIIELTDPRSIAVIPDISNLKCKNLIISNIRVLDFEPTEWLESQYEKIITSNRGCKNIYVDEDKYYPNDDYAIVINIKMHNIVLDNGVLKIHQVNPRDVYTKL